MRPEAEAQAAAAGFEPVVAAMRGLSKVSAEKAGSLITTIIRERDEWIEQLERELALAESELDRLRGLRRPG